MSHLMMMSKMTPTKDKNSYSPIKNDTNKKLLTSSSTSASTHNRNRRDTTDEIISNVEAIISGAKDDDDDNNDTGSFASTSVTETVYAEKKDIDHVVDVDVEAQAQAQVQTQDDYEEHYEVPVVFNKNNININHDDDDDDDDDVVMMMPIVETTILARETSSGSYLSHYSLDTTHHTLTTLSRQVSAEVYNNNNANTDGGSGSENNKKKISNVEECIQSDTKRVHRLKKMLIVFISLMGIFFTTSIGICVNKFYQPVVNGNNKKLLLSVGVVTALASLFVGGMFVSIFILLILYDRSVEQRQRKLVRVAEQTDAIVSDLYPIEIQRKLMMIDRDNNNNVITRNINGNSNNNNKDSLLMSSSHHQEKENAPVPSSSVVVAASDDQASKSYPPKDKYNFQHRDAMIISGTNHTSTTNTTASSSLGRDGFRRDWWASTKSLSSVPQRMLSLASSSTSISGLTSAPLDDDIDGLLSRYGNTKPIADFYPATTIMMCDLAGFTAWSSQRSPSDVFRLLETIYGAFDDIARAENVFKVETVGDCYVACAGLPQKQPKHAVIMARFAKKCLRRYETLIKKLEKYLGPDTTDLGIRVGLHSGGVTAGVLRGDKTRYQLFGDTVNTASRMESTGQVNKIQVSSETAKLLIDAGHGKSVIERENLVTVKGKGEMQTYWIRSSSSSSGLRRRKQKPRRTSLERKLEAGAVANSMHTSSFDNENDTNSIGTTLSVDSSIMSPPKRMQSWTPSDTARNPKEHRLIEWIVETLMKSLKKIAVDRRGTETIRNNSFPLADFDSDGLAIEEIKEVIPIRQGVALSLSSPAVADVESSPEGNHYTQFTAEVSHAVEDQLRDYVTVISLLYHDNAFHNFEHAAHVLMSVSKLMSRMLENKTKIDESINDDGMAIHKEEEEEEEDHTYGVTSDPMIEFACLFSALIHDVDHNGVPNSTLIKENTATADHYSSKSVAEQHSIDLAWSLLMEPCYEDLRKSIYQTQQERTRFRQVVVNSVMATDIMDANLKKFRDDRWEKAINLKNDDMFWGKSIENSNRMATIAIEHIIQASDISHTCQHWQVYLKFNERLFREMYQAYKDGRAERDPSEFWYKGELDFFDSYVIPLATKLKESGVFGVSSDEYLNYAKSNRMEWALKGQHILKGYMETGV